MMELALLAAGLLFGLFGGMVIGCKLSDEEWLKYYSWLEREKMKERAKSPIRRVG